MPLNGLARSTTKSWASTRLPRTTTTRVSGNPARPSTLRNKKEWDKLPKEYQAAFQAAAYEANVTMMAEYDHKNPIALSKLLQTASLQSFSDEILAQPTKPPSRFLRRRVGQEPGLQEDLYRVGKYRKTQNAWFSVAEMRMDRFLQSHK